MSQPTEEISLEITPELSEVIDFHNKFFLTNFVKNWTLAQFYQYCVSDVYFADYHLCDDGSNSRVRHGFKCGVQKALKQAPPFENLKITPQEYMLLSDFLGKELYTKRVKRQRFKAALPGKVVNTGDIFNGDTFHGNAINIKGNKDNSCTSLSGTNYLC